MAKVSLANHMREQPSQEENEGPESAGPFVSISRQYGCYGFSLGLLLMEILNEGAAPEETWKIYHREILERLADETNLATEFLDQQRRSKSGLLGDFFRALSREKLPSGYQVRKEIMTIVRGLAVDGYAIIIGQNSSIATRDLENGIRVRLEAPEQWRVKEIAFREGLSETEARMRIRANDKERAEVRKLYLARSKVSFDLTYDCSSFSLAQIAQHVVQAMRFKDIA